MQKPSYSCLLFCSPVLLPIATLGTWQNCHLPSRSLIERSYLLLTKLRRTPEQRHKVHRAPAQSPQNSRTKSAELHHRSTELRHKVRRTPEKKSAELRNKVRRTPAQIRGTPAKGHKTPHIPGKKLRRPQPGVRFLETLASPAPHGDNDGLSSLEVSRGHPP